MTKGPKIRWIYYDQDSRVTLWEDIAFNINHMTVQKPKNIAKKVIGPAFEENGLKYHGSEAKIIHDIKSL